VKTMIRKVAVVLAVCMALAAAVFAGVSYHEKYSQVFAARENLYQQWERYLSFSEALKSVQLWTLEYVDAFFQEDSWDNLVRARAAVAAGKVKLNRLEAPQLELDGDLREALKKLIEERAILMDGFSSAAMELKSARNLMANLTYSLEEFFLYQKERLLMDAQVRYAMEDIALDGAYIAAATNRLYAAWDMKARFEKLEEKYPTLAGFGEPWEKNLRTLETRADSLVDQMDALYMQYSSSLLYAESSQKDVEAAVYEGKTGELLLQCQAIEGMPAALPAPLWLQEPRETFYVQDVDGKTQIVVFGTDLECVPSSVVFYYDYVTREEYEDYCRYLQSAGCTCLESKKADGSIVALIEKDGSSLAIQWSEGETMLINRSPMASLMPPLLYELLLENKNM